MPIAAGYEDANDCNTLRHDGVLKICAGQEQSLATQPTMSRFENRLGRKELYNMAKAFVDNFIASYSSQPGAIILDCDDTCAVLYGQQELRLFNSYYGDTCKKVPIVPLSSRYKMPYSSFLANYWNVVDWKVVENRYKKAIK